MKVERRIVALAGLLRRTRVPVDWQHIRDELAPLGAYQGSHSTVRKQLQRDLGRLRELGLSARYDAGEGGYSLDEDSRRPRHVELSGPEASLLRHAAALVTLDASSPFGPDVHAALETLEAYDIAGPEHVIVHQTGLDVPGLSEMCRMLAMAAWKRRVCSFTYRHLRGEQRLLRHIEPWGLYSRQGRWYLAGRCRQREAQRTFRVSLIEDLRVPDLSTAGAQFDTPADFDIQEQANQEPWDWAVHEPVNVVLHASGGLAPIVARRLQGRVDGDEVHRTVTNADALWDLLHEWLPRVRFVAPVALAEANDSWFSDIAARHGGTHVATP